MSSTVALRAIASKKGSICCLQFEFSTGEIQKTTSSSPSKFQDVLTVNYIINFDIAEVYHHPCFHLCYQIEALLSSVLPDNLHLQS